MLLLLPALTQHIFFRKLLLLPPQIPLGQGSLPWLQLRHAINLHKVFLLLPCYHNHQHHHNDQCQALCGPVMIALILVTSRVSAATCTYAALHGCYGWFSSSSSSSSLLQCYHCSNGKFFNFMFTSDYYG